MIRQHALLTSSFFFNLLGYRSFYFFSFLYKIFVSITLIYIYGNRSVGVHEDVIVFCVWPHNLASALRKINCNMKRVKIYLCFPAIDNFWWNSQITFKIVLACVCLEQRWGICGLHFFCWYWCAMEIIENIIMMTVSTITYF